MPEVFKKILSLLTKHDRKLLYWLAFTIVLISLIDVAGVASIMPFMAVVGNPEVVHNNHYLFKIYQMLGLKSVNNFLVILGCLVFVIILINNLMKALVLRIELRFVHFRLYHISRRLLYSYLNQPYAFYLDNNVSNLGKNILQEVSQFTHNVLRPCTQILSRIFVVLFIIGFLFVVDPVLAIIISSILGSSYVLIYLLVQKKMARLGTERFSANTERSKTVSEVFGGVKELKVLNRERFFFDQFSAHALTMETNVAVNNLVSQLPSYIMECLTFGGILIIVVYFLIVKQNLGNTLPVIALYAFSGYRLMPALQGIFSAVTLLRFNVSVIDSLQRDLAGISEIPNDWKKEMAPALAFVDKIEFSAVSFQYPTADFPTIQELNLTIKKNSSIGFMGATGSGKSTIVDILLGLLIPQQGSLLVDGGLVDSSNMRNWQRNLGYVPQSIFLCDDTLARNIAIGVAPEEIDMAAVERAARIANIHDFVVAELPGGYQAVVGERGVRLSGGQRQRIGIARALYHDPNVLIMDEATSALDGVTEDAVIHAIRNLAGSKTIITIAHRLTTLKDCDVVYIIDKGNVVEKGSYDQLSGLSARFQAMASSGTS